MRMTPEWCEGLHQNMREGITEASGLTSTLYLTIMERVWEGRIDRIGRTWKFNSFGEYLTANPMGGLYTKVEDLRKLITHDARVLEMFDAEIKRGGGAK